jgi:hypothetical protein
LQAICLTHRLEYRHWEILGWLESNVGAEKREVHFILWGSNDSIPTNDFQLILTLSDRFIIQDFDCDVGSIGPRSNRNNLRNSPGLTMENISWSFRDGQRIGLQGLPDVNQIISCIHSSLPNKYSTCVCLNCSN